MYICASKIKKPPQKEKNCNNNSHTESEHVAQSFLSALVTKRLPLLFALFAFGLFPRTCKLMHYTCMCSLLPSLVVVWLWLCECECVCVRVCCLHFLSQLRPPLLAGSLHPPPLHQSTILIHASPSSMLFPSCPFFWPPCLAQLAKWPFLVRGCSQ